MLYPDLESQPVNDGRFQLKGFRHVSGMSDVEGAGGLEEYLSHVKRESSMAVDGQAGSNPELTGSRRMLHPTGDLPARPSLSRPPSVAASLASVDDCIMPSNRVSVAAFRKGIRRPSEGPGTMSDVGHGELDDDDDVPLGMRPKGFGAARVRSSASSSSLPIEQEEVTRKTSPRPSPTLSPGMTFAVHKRNGGGSGGFVVKSAKTTRTILPHNSLERAASDPWKDSFVSPTPNSPSSPALPDTQEIVNTPDIVSPVDGYFSSGVLPSTSNRSQTSTP